MSTLKFKTTIKCNGCQTKATPFLNEIVGENNWHVDLQHPDRILTVPVTEATEAQVIEAVKQAGYNATPIS